MTTKPPTDVELRTWDEWADGQIRVGLRPPYAHTADAMKRLVATVRAARASATTGDAPTALDGYAGPWWCPTCDVRIDRAADDSLRCARCRSHLDRLPDSPPANPGDARLRTALKEAAAGLEVAASRYAPCPYCRPGGFRCSVHMALDYVRAALKESSRE